MAEAEPLEHESSSITARPFHRVLLKLSGEALSGHRDYGIDQEHVEALATEIAGVHGEGTELAIVVGGGNIMRGMEAAAAGMDRATADYAGMLASVLNSLTVQDALERRGAQTRIQSAINVAEVAEPYIRRRAVRHLEKGRIVIFAAGMGAPFFSTDTTAAQRALEIGAEAILKGTKVDGVYSADPLVDPSARRFESIEYLDVLREGYQVMDATAISLCMENKLPIIVFDFRREGNIRRALSGEPIGTLVHGGA